MKKSDKKIKRIMILLFILFNLLGFSQFLFALHDWHDSLPNSENQQSYSNYKSLTLGPGKLVSSSTELYQPMVELASSSYSPSGNTVLIVINKNVYDTLNTYNYTGGTTSLGPPNLLDRYFYHLKKEYGIIVCTYSGKMDINTDATSFKREISPPDQIRDEIKSRYDNKAVYGKIVGCIFIGELPVKWSKNQEKIEGQNSTLEFPMDLYYMDMETVSPWTINTTDGMLTLNSGAYPKPDIWVGRITSINIGGIANESTVIASYLNKNIAFRESAPTDTYKALVYDGSNNIPAASNYPEKKSWIDTIIEIFKSNQNVTVISSSTGNKPSFFLYDISAYNIPAPDNDPSSNYEFVHFGTNSSAFTQTFDLLDITNPKISIVPSDILNPTYKLNPRYYFIEGAGATRFTGGTGTTYIGGCYIFSSKSNGLTLVGSTKSIGDDAVGSFQIADEFYNKLRYRCFGESLAAWMAVNLSNMDNYPGFDGMAIIGDPTLKLYNAQAKSIDDGLRYISTRSRASDGKGETSPTGTIGDNDAPYSRPAVISLAALAYLNWGVTDNTIVNNALSKITTSYTAGGWLVEIPDPADNTKKIAYVSAYSDGHEEYHSGYNTACAALVLTGLPTLTANQKTILTEFRDYLLKCQRPNKGFGYDRAMRSDNSNTQFALMGIYMATYKLNMDGSGNGFIPADIQTNVFDPCVTTWLTPQVANGGSRGTNNGHCYGAPGYGDSSTTIETANAAWSAMLCNPKRTDDPTKTDYTLPDADFLWLKNHLTNPFDIQSAASNNYWAGYGEFYYAWTLAKACAMRKKDMPFDDGKNWYQELSNAIIKRQDKTNSNWPIDGWLSVDNGGIEFSTILSILALQTQQINPDINIYRAFILHSHSDLHLYDSEGKLHTGINDSGKIDNQIPGSRFIVYRKDDPAKKPIPYEKTLNSYGNVGEEYAQEIDVWMPDPGKYRIEIVGNENANHVVDPKYDLIIQTKTDNQIVSTKEFDGIPIKGPDPITGKKDVQSTFDVVAVLDGQVPLVIEKPDVSAGMEITPVDQDIIIKATDTKAKFNIVLKETSGKKDLHLIHAYCSNFRDAIGKHDIIGTSVVFDIPADYNLTAGQTLPITVTVPIPAGFSGPSFGEILISSNDGIAKTATVTIKTNTPPVANAGPDQTAFAGADGTATAMVTLDGSASSDADNDALTYTWFENTTQIATGIKPVVKLSVGTHSISLKANDGKEDSQLDEVVITVVAAKAGQLHITPVVINRLSHSPWVMASITLPTDVKKENVDLKYKVKMYTPAGDAIEAKMQYILPGWYWDNGCSSRCSDQDRKMVCVVAYFSRTDITAKLKDDGVYKISEVCKLTDGHYVNGQYNISVIGKNMKPAFLSIKPPMIRVTSKMKNIVTHLSLPYDVKRKDVNMNGKVTLHTLSGESVDAEILELYPKTEPHNNEWSHYEPKTTIVATFSAAKLVKLIPESGVYELYETCPLLTGDSLVGFSMIKIWNFEKK